MVICEYTTRYEDMPDYVIVEVRTSAIGALTKAVNELLSRGYVLHGEVITYTRGYDYISQPMIKKEGFRK